MMYSHSQPASVLYNTPCVEIEREVSALRPTEGHASWRTTQSVAHAAGLRAHGFSTKRNRWRLWTTRQQDFQWETGSCILSGVPDN